MLSKEQCKAIIEKSNGVPSCIKSLLDSLVGFELCEFDHTYIEFLEEQIALNARGEDWTQVLRVRKEILEPYIGRELMRCELLVDKDRYSFRIDAERLEVVHWECQ